MRGLNNKVIVVAGGGPGNIGGATARRLSEEGASVVVADLNEAGATSVADAITSAGGTATAHHLDITDESSYAELIAFTTKELGGVDGLFNVAADLSPHNLGRDTDVLSVPNDVWQHTIDVTLTGYRYGIRHAMPVMLERGGGSIVNTMSAAVWMAEPVRVAYAVAKAGLSALTLHTATIGGNRGVRCNAVAPGMVMTDAAVAANTKETLDEQLSRVRSTRLGRPEDIAAMVAFLMSADGEWVNGQLLLVDGGANLR